MKNLKDKKIDFKLFYNSLTRSKGLWFDDDEDEEENIDEDFFRIENPDDTVQEEANSYVKSPISVFEDYKKSRDIFFEKSQKNNNIKWISAKKLEDKIKETSSLIYSNENITIVNGACEYNGAIASFYALDTKEGILYVDSFSVTPIVKDIAKAYFVYNVVKKNYNKIFSIKFICRSEEETYEPKKFYFKFTEYAECKKGKTKENSVIVKKIGLTNFANLNLQLNNQDEQEAKLINMIDKNQFYKFGYDNKNNKVKLIANTDCFFNESFDAQLSYIKSNIDFKFNITDYKDKYISIYDENKGVWGDNKNFNKLFETYFPELNGLHGNYVAKKSLLSDYSKGEEAESIKKAKKFLSIKDEYIIPNVEKIEEEIRKIDSKKIVWYDYESISLPYAIIKNTTPYQQIIFQVSIIKTNNNKQTKCYDLVYDPKTLTPMDFVDNFYHLYEKNADYYIVFNKNFENIRNKEMIKIIEKSFNEDKDFANNVLKKYNLNFDNLKSMQEEINNKTYDLADFFNYKKGEEKSYQNEYKIPRLYIPSLKLYYSIKKVEKFVSAKPQINLENKIKKYDTLNIKNGLYAQEAGIRRFLGECKDNEWKVIEEDLKEYCHNDVMAMLMAFDLVKYFYNKEKQKNIKNQ
ncbi:UU173 family protein [Mycoplasma elephantis]|uniref:UU173 family protein n=1 Tax=Mycoplasma elephantis TaxID=114882 RepID=UPI000482DFE2|nr:DUF2779 domain-containing protein [Mycoplasma elephantis]